MRAIKFKGGYDRNLSYILFDEKTKKAVVIDPFKEIGIYLEKAKELNLEITGILNTHEHRDHVVGNSFFEKKGFEIIKPKKNFIAVGNSKIRIIKTPGHTPNSVCFLENGKVFTGDTLFAKRVGIVRTIETTRELYGSLKKLKKLPNKTLVYPGHEYEIEIPTTIGKEKKQNPYLKCGNFKEFDALISKWRDYANKRYFARRLKWLKYRYINGLFSS
ncbi:hypothetical protein HY449_01250 [Candidatus Pacearchaeota archaeon]|nr:hypothetical protein [Candidatus Pacearchaeota archaeon]